MVTTYISWLEVACLERFQWSYNRGTMAMSMCLQAFNFDSFLLRPTAYPTSISLNSIVVLKRAISLPGRPSDTFNVGST